MTTAKQVRGVVPSSPSLGNGTAGRFDKLRDGTRDGGGTASLKTLAKQVLHGKATRDDIRDDCGTMQKNAVPCPQTVRDDSLHEWQYKYLERAGIIAEDTHNTLGMYAERLAFLETLVEYLQERHKGIIGQFKELIKPRVH